MGLGCTDIKGDAGPPLITSLRTQVGEPGDIEDEFLTEDREVVGPLLRGGDHHDLFVGVFKERPEHKGSRNPGLTNPSETLELEALGTVLEVVAHDPLGTG